MFLDAELLQMGILLMIPELLIFGGIWVLMAFLLWNPKKRDHGNGPGPSPRKRFPSFPSFLFKNKIF